ncbi:MAG: hypothetical protein LBJ00_08520 [Planctomycetaceae bacterium]|nr:hypothetical protein [Planctomycetaceae bacterium]
MKQLFKGKICCSYWFWCRLGRYAQAVLKFLKLDTQVQQREAVVQWRSLSPIPALV